MFGDDLLSLETPPRWSFANQHGTPSILSALCAHHVLTVLETKQLLEKPKQYQIHQVSMSTNHMINVKDGNTSSTLSMPKKSLRQKK